jgi:hypothetical protein
MRKLSSTTNYEKTILNYKLWENYPQLQIIRKLSSTTNYEKTILNYKLWENYPQLQIMRKLFSTTNYEKTILNYKLWENYPQLQIMRKLSSNSLSFPQFLLGRVPLIAQNFSEWFMFNSSIFQLYHGENKLIFNVMMMRSALY